MRCPRCESSNGEDFFQNTVKQTRFVAGADLLEGGLGSFEFDSKQWTCKKCMVRCVSEEAFQEQKWQAGLLNRSPEERKRVTEERSRQKFVEKHGVEPLSDRESLPYVFGALVFLGLVGWFFYWSWNF